MTRQPLNKAQQKAVESKSKKFTVLASAGAGKTKVLAERFLRLVTEEKLSPDEILTLTFTKKAAAEMKRRISEELNKRGFSDQAQIAESGPIQTISSFCENFLRENAIAAKMDPDFAVIETHQQEQIHQEVLREVLTSNLTEEKHIQEFIEIKSGTRRWNSLNTLESSLIDSIRQTVTFFRDGDYPKHKLDELYNSQKSYETGLANFLAQEFEGSDEILENMDKDQISFAQILNEYRNTKSFPFDKRIKESYNLPHEVLTLRLSFALGQISLEYWRILEEKLSQANLLDFSKIENKTLELLQEDENVLARTSQKFKALLVDEAQDLNKRQHKILEILSIPNEVFIGDDQQSIYKFRFSEPELFLQKSQQESIILHENYRTENNLLYFFNDLFKSIWDSSYRPMTKESQPSGESGGVDIYESQEPVMDILPIVDKLLKEDKKSLKDICILCRRHSVISNITSTLEKANIPYRIEGESDRLLARMEVRDLSAALTFASDPFDNYSAACFLLSPFVNASLDTVVALTKKGSIINHLNEQELPVADDREKIDEMLEWFLPIQKSADRRPAWEILSELLHKSPFMEEIAKRPGAELSLSNVRKILLMASERQDVNASQFAEIIKNLQELKTRQYEPVIFDQQADVLTLMTVHASKGLEFDTVILPDFTSRTQNIQPATVTTLNQGLISISTAKKSGLVSRIAHEFDKEKSREEELRVLYVAMTRAKSHLVMMWKPNIKNSLAYMVYDICKDWKGIKVHNKPEVPAVESNL